MDIAGVISVLIAGTCALFFIRDVPNSERWRTFLDYLFKMCLGALVAVIALWVLSSEFGVRII